MSNGKSKKPSMVSILCYRKVEEEEFFKQSQKETKLELPSEFKLFTVLISTVFFLKMKNNVSFKNFDCGYKVLQISLL